MLQYYTAYHQFWWGTEENGPDVISRSSTNCDNSGKNVNNKCMCNILKHSLNNSFFFEFMMHIFLWGHVIPVSGVYSFFLPQALSMNSNCRIMALKKDTQIWILFIFPLMLWRTVVICTKSNLISYLSRNNLIMYFKRWCFMAECCFNAVNSSNDIIWSGCPICIRNMYP